MAGSVSVGPVVEIFTLFLYCLGVTEDSERACFFYFHSETRILAYQYNF